MLPVADALDVKNSIMADPQERLCRRHRGVSLRIVVLLAPIGPMLNQKGVHSTAVLGPLGAATGCSQLLGLNANDAPTAVDIAATMGLCPSFGTQLKPIQAG